MQLKARIDLARWSRNQKPEFAAKNRAQVLTRDGTDFTECREANEQLNETFWQPSIF
jgi:hypothetical protein